MGSRQTDVPNIKVKGHFFQKLSSGHTQTRPIDRSTWTTKWLVAVLKNYQLVYHVLKTFISP